MKSTKLKKCVGRNALTATCTILSSGRATQSESLNEAIFKWNIQTTVDNDSKFYLNVSFGCTLEI